MHALRARNYHAAESPVNDIYRSRRADAVRVVREESGKWQSLPTPARRRVRVALGRVYVTPAALDELMQAEALALRDREGEPSEVLRASAGLSPLPARCLIRHMTGDWGDICADDAAANDRALTSGERLLSVYVLATGVRIWIITEADRASTTILLPDEY